MKRFTAIMMTALMLLGITRGQDCQVGEYKTAKVSFAPVAVYIDSGDKPLAAYQFEFKAVKGEIKIVGVEGGESKAFHEPPYYDPKALMNNRIIIAAFNTGKDLPIGKTRITTLHLQIIGDVSPEYEAKLVAAATADGQEISAQISISTITQEGQD
jgi:hypothetical protein